MDWERDVLTRVVFPAVNDRLTRAGYGSTVYPVDLRWGVATEEGGGDRNRRILATCVEEVERCRPLFLGLLGEREGWLPDRRLQVEALRAAGLRDPGFEVTATALEILAAVAAGERDGKAPLILERRSARGIGAQRMPDTMQHLRRFLVGRGVTCRPYDARWNETDLHHESDEFVRVATDALWRLASSVLTPRSSEGWLTDELAAQSAYRSRLSATLVGREPEVEAIRTFWRRRLGEGWSIGDDPERLGKTRPKGANHAIALLGDSGIGKSAIAAFIAQRVKVAHYYDELARDLQNRPTVHVSVGITELSGRLPIVILLLIAQLEPDSARAIAREHGPSALELAHVEQCWLKILTTMGHDAPLVVVDGLDRLEGEPNEVVGLHWLPTQLRDDLKLLLTATPESVAGMLLSRRVGTEVMVLDELSPGDAELLVNARATARHKSIPVAVVKSMVADSRVARWLVVATELIFALMRHDYLAVRNLPRGIDPDAALASLVINSTRRLPGDLTKLHEEAYWRLIQLAGNGVGLVLAFLVTVTGGLRDRDIRNLLQERDATLDASDLALIRSVLTGHVDVEGEHWRFAHPTAFAGALALLDQVEDQVPGTTAAYSRLLGNYLLGLPFDDPVRERELLPLLVEIPEGASLLLELLAHPGTSRAALGFLSSALSVLVLEGVPEEVIGTLCRASGPPVGKLTLLELILASMLPLLSMEARAECVLPVVECAEALPSGLTGRFGMSPSEVLANARILAENADQERFLSELVAAGRVAIATQETLRTQLARSRESVGSGLTSWLPRASIIVNFALLCAWSRLPSRPEDARAARVQLTSWRRKLVDQDELAIARSQVVLDVVERAANCAWPAYGFQPKADDFDRAAKLADSLFGSPFFVHLIVMATQAHAATLPQLLSDGEEITAEDAVVLERLLRQVEEAAWRVDVQRALNPGDLMYELSAIQLGFLRLSILVDGGQLDAGGRIGLALCAEPHAVDILGWPEDFFTAAMMTICCLEGSYSRDDAWPVVGTVLNLVLTHGVESFDQDMVEGLPLIWAFGVDNSFRSGCYSRIPELISVGSRLIATGYVQPEDIAEGCAAALDGMVNDISEVMGEIADLVEDVELEEIVAVVHATSALAQYAVEIRPSVSVCASSVYLHALIWRLAGDTHARAYANSLLALVSDDVEFSSSDEERISQASGFLLSDPCGDRPRNFEMP